MAEARRLEWTTCGSPRGDRWFWTKAAVCGASLDGLLAIELDDDQQ
jgi:hypothetical protein